jgi:orotidine-5'-phosphate decarboxylase
MPTDKFIIALDMDNPKTALDLVRKIKGEVSFFKVGLQLYTREGPAFVRDLRREGVDVFLDLKMHDIPQTISNAVEGACDLEVRFLTIHTSGGAEMISAAVQAAKGSATQVLGITVLTSLDDQALREIGFDHSTTGQVLHLARLATKCGLTGLVCSPLEIEQIRQLVGRDIILVTPGIRSGKDEKQDQKRTLSAAEALKRGATHLVIGRPVTQAADPLAAVIELKKECGL